MSRDQTVIILILGATIAMFMWGRWRHDMVALGALLASVLTGLTSPLEAFSGFSHPAVVTVACVLVMSYGLQASGAVDVLTQHIRVQSAGRLTTIAILTALAAVMSAFMNNVGALALLMPVAIKAARDRDLPPGQLLMPLSFGSILGGMTTLIGTPPNLIVSGFRGAAMGNTFAMFDFAPVGLTVAVAGVAFVVLVGWRLVPVRERAGAEGFETAAYLTEAQVTEGSKLDGAIVRDAEVLLDEADAQIIGLIRDGSRIPAPHPLRKLRTNDILVIRAEPEALGAMFTNLALKLVDMPETDTAEDRKTEAGDAVKAVKNEEVLLSELAVLPGSRLAGRSAAGFRLRERYGVNLLAVSRQGRRSMARLRNTILKEGDVLLMQGGADALGEFAVEFGCVPLAEREVRIPDRKRAYLAMAIMATAVAGASFGLAPAAISFAAGVLAMMAFGVVARRSVYEAIDWPVIVLLGALIPVAGALAASGAADMIARVLLDGVAQGYGVAALVVILIVTMTLSDFMNNAATAAVMCPIAIGTAGKLGASADPFLMAVAVGASCAFLTPIGHQNNTLILGPGGFRFGDYWRLGLPVEIIVVAVGVPMILIVWPL
ncbi:SLC13 family permease [Varunaivibrio sulfuroxidans]|uniref:Di/tricarboxylate transporter n=1 Tax=Varunaivibrio sulfuroxidans TaxID=1773489 RepID=A0A4V2UP68_9PROT|nr:SLC13 family permease [Varunaivibrio sulfuroxidans]TCS64701.1 di/tricarboxylate transporter [Varunaivibrio sulfuroxidans]WES29992.1 SLC13 family permease [Varunaivibrio sulfuroxidans]